MPDKKEKDIARVMKILEANEHLDFVQRILSPEQYPELTTEDGYRATHQMADSEADGKFYAYPSIVHSKGALSWLEDNDAFQYAMDSGERISFDSAEDANWFAKNYKLIWPEDKQ